MIFAIGVPGESVGAIIGAGAVHLLYGARRMELPRAAASFGARTARRSPMSGAVRWFRTRVLAAADFGNGAQADLAIGIPSRTSVRWSMQVR